MDNHTESDSNPPEEKAIDVLTDKVPVIVCGKCGCEIDVADLDPFVHLECPDCGNVETVPAKLGNFLLLKLIGTGGMGGVYYAKDEGLGRFVAIKVMLKSTAENTAFVESLKREAQAVARLNHPNIVQVYSFGQEKGQPFIVMELVSGQRFDRMVEAKQALDQAFVMRIGLDIAEGLKAADEAGLLHGDIKPENILLDEKMRAKLVDFGIATMANQGQLDGVWGTPYYIAPEKVRRQKVDCRSDIYSLGATLFHALSGRAPFEGKTPVEVIKARLQHPAQELHLVRHDIDPFIEKIIMRMLEGDPGRRYPNYNSLISDMRKAVQQLSAPSAGGGLAAELGKKLSTGTFAPAPNQDAPPSRTARIVIRKKSTTATAAPPPVAKEGESSNQLDATAVAVDVPAKDAPVKIAPTKEQRAKRKRIAITIFAIVLLALLIGGIIALVKRSSNKRRAELAQKRETYFLGQSRAKVEDLYRKILLTTSNVVAMANGTEAFVDQATNTVFFILNEPLDLPEPPPPVEETQPAAPETNVAPAAPITTATPAIPAAPAAPGTDKSQPAAGSGATTTESRVAQPAATKADTNASPVAAVPPAAPVKPTEEPPKRKAPPPNEPEPKPTARKVIAAVDTLAANAAAATELQAAATIARNEAATSNSSAVAAVKVGVLTEDLTKAETLVIQSRAALDNARKALKKIADMKTSREAAIRAENKAADDRAKADAAAEAEKKKLEDLKKLAENEKAMVEAARSNCLPMLKQYKFKDIADALSAQTGSYQTEEGKAAFKVLIDRYTRLQRMKAFVITQLNAAPFQWGMTLPRVGSVDVLGADENNVKIKDRSIPWTEISTAQMKKFIDHCLASPKLKVREQGDQNLAAAIFCFENGGAGVKLAATYAETAAQLCPDLQAEVKRLLPLE